MKKLIYIIMAHIFLFTSLACPEPASNYNHIRPKVGINSERMLVVMEKPVELLVLDDEEMQRDVLTQALSASNVKKIDAAGSIEEGLDLLRDNPGIIFLVVDYRLGNYESNREDNGVEFCHRAIHERGFKGKIVILSADDKAVIKKLAEPQYQDLYEGYLNGEILLRNKSDFDAIKNIKQIVEGGLGAVKPAKEVSDEEILNLITVNLDLRDIGIEPAVIKQFSDCHVIIADDKPFMRSAFEKTFKQFFANTHKASNVDEVTGIISELRGKGVPDREIIVLSDYEFGTEQTGKRARDGHDLLMALRLHQGLNFKGGFIFVSGSIVSKHEIQGYDPIHKDISQEIKDMYGIDYIEKSTDREFQKNLVKMVYLRLQAPYNLEKPITKPLGRRPLSQPADIIFLNGGINDFEARLSMAINNLIKALDGISVNPETRESLGVLLKSMLRFVDFGAVDRNMIFNARVHNYKGKLGLIGSYFIPAIQEYIQKLGANNRSKFDKFIEELDNLSLTLGIASNYTKRLLDLSSVVGNIGRPISFEDLKKISLEAFSQEYSNRINLKIDTDESQFKETEFPYALTFIMSYILENAVEQYALRFGKEFKCNIFVAISKDAGSGEPVININIQDEAGGIAEHLLPDGLFKRQVTDKKEHGGTGYGLFWAKELIEMFGGSISAGNKDKGAFFNVRLPVDWKSRFDVNGRVKKLEARIAEILTKRQVKDAKNIGEDVEITIKFPLPESQIKNLEQEIADILTKRQIPNIENLSAKIAKEIEDYSSMLAGIAERREVNVSKRGSEIKRDMPNYLASLNIEVGAHRLIIEQGVTKEDIQNCFLSLLTLGSVEEIEAVKAPFLTDRQLVRILDEGSPALLLRTKENVSRENEPIAPEEREDYQKTLRFLGYSIHKLAGGGSGLVRGFLRWYGEFSEDDRNEIMQEFNQHDPVDMLGSVHYLTNSEGQLTGFENDRVIIERISGWKGVIKQLVENASRVPQEVKRRLDLIDPEAFKRERRFTRHMNDFIEDGHGLAAILNNEPIRDKRWINEYLASYPGEGSRLKNVKHFNLNAAPGTRLWLKEFFLDNIMLNVFRLTVGGVNCDEDLRVDVSEQEGSTVFNARYKGDVDIDTAFKVKVDTKEPWYNGPLLLWLIKAMDGKIEITKDSENVNIRISFPLSSEAMESPAANNARTSI
ncbi:MAG: ATP-binding protein [Candidatus Omnitrophota bacterium]|nr:ATP-binding protein [Candidatus Omnitrophota bacterium]